MMLIKAILFIWIVGGSVLYFTTFTEDDAKTNEEICSRFKCPSFLAMIFGYLVTVTIGFPFFIYRTATILIKGGTSDGSMDNGEDEEID